MSELEERINSVLGDPAQLEQISRLARSLMGGGENTGPQGGGPAPQGNTGDILGQLGVDGESIARISRMFSTQSAGGSGSSRALLEAMKPYLSDKRRQKVDKALKIAHLAKLAGLAMGEMEGGND